MLRRTAVQIVLISTAPKTPLHRATSLLEILASSVTGKLSRSWTGPYRVHSVTGPTGHLHNTSDVLMVSAHRLKHYHSPFENEIKGLPEGIFLVDKIVDEKQITHNDITVTKYRVRWAGYTPRYDTWEPSTSLPVDVVTPWNSTPCIAPEPTPEKVTEPHINKKKPMAVPSPTPAPTFTHSGCLRQVTQRPDFDYKH